MAIGTANIETRGDAMHPTFKKAALPGALMLAAATLTGCIVRPAPYYDGGEYYARAAPDHCSATLLLWSRPSYWHRNRWHGGWHGGRHHWAVTTTDRQASVRKLRPACQGGAIIVS
jgi:hypothetical protein